jgi:arsenate reductase
MAESLMRHIGGGRFIAASAGSHPSGVIASIATETMRRMGVSMEGQYSKSWNVFQDQPQDIIITVCDSAAATPCPVWPAKPRAEGRPVIAHWSLPDPTLYEGTLEQRLAMARHVAGKTLAALEALAGLPLDDLAPQPLREALARIAPDASEFRPPP